jgi:hypothetical protein
MSADADSQTDALWHNGVTGDAVLTLSTGPSSSWSLAPGWTAILPVHLNADSDTDLLFYNTLVPININGDHLTDVLRYHASSGRPRPELLALQPTCALRRSASVSADGAQPRPAEGIWRQRR